MTEDEYRAARAALDRLNKMIADAPMKAKPVFRGIAKLHDRVHRYEREHRISHEK